MTYGYYPSYYCCSCDECFSWLKIQFIHTGIFFVQFSLVSSWISAHTLPTYLLYFLKCARLYNLCACCGISICFRAEKHPAECESCLISVHNSCSGILQWHSDDVRVPVPTSHLSRYPDQHRLVRARQCARRVSHLFYWRLDCGEGNSSQNGVKTFFSRYFGSQLSVGCFIDSLETINNSISA